MFDIPLSVYLTFNSLFSTIHCLATSYSIFNIPSVKPYQPPYTRPSLSHQIPFIDTSYSYHLSYPLRVCPTPSQQVFSLCIHSGNISVCNGCRNKFDKNASPPNDLCIQHQEWHSFIYPLTNALDS